MITLYQQTDPIKDAGGNIIGYESKPVVFPDTFPLLSGLKFDWANNIVERNGKKYYIDRYTEITKDIPSIDKWKSIYGNTIENYYYSGLLQEHDDNPTGNVSNIKRSVYKSLGVVKYILEFKYDANDNVVSIASIAPVEIAAGEFDDTEEEVIDESQRLPLNNLKIIPFWEMSENKLGENVIVSVVKSKNMALVSQTGRRTPIFSDGIKVGDDVTRMHVSFDTSKFANWYAVVYGVDGNGRTIYSDRFKDSYDIPNIERDIKFIFICITPTNGNLESIKVTQLTQYNVGLEVEMIISHTIFIVNDRHNNPPQYYDCATNDVIKLSDIVEDRMMFPIVSSQGLMAVPDGYTDINTGDFYTLDAEIVVTQSLHLEVHYAGPCVLSINNDNGDDIIEKKYFFNEDITLDVPTKDGFLFQYYTDADGNILPDTFRIDKDTTITAQWYEL